MSRKKVEAKPVEQPVKEIVVMPSQAIEPARSVSMVPHAPVQDLMLTAAFDLETAKKRLKELQDFVKFYLVEGEDYGIIPGTVKPTLYKPGADKLCDIYAMADTYRMTSRTEDWDRNLFDYEFECMLQSKRDQSLISTGVGSCNSYEGRYRYRDQQRQCPQCHGAFIIKGKEEYGGGWLCYKKKGGCGAKFGDGDPAIEGQPIGKITNDDIPTLKNTILKMAKKRAKVDAVLSATRSSGLFTQDMEDIAAVENHEEGKPAQASSAKKSQTKTGAQSATDENVILQPHGDAAVQLSGTGLSRIIENFPADFCTSIGMLHFENKVWIFARACIPAFIDMCAKFHIGVLHKGFDSPQQDTQPKQVPPQSSQQQAPASTKTTQKASPSGNATAQAETSFQKETRNISGGLQKVFKGTAQNAAKTPFRSVTVNDKPYFLFRNEVMHVGASQALHIFEILDAARPNCPVQFVIESRQKRDKSTTWDIKAFLMIDRFEWELDGTPVLRREPATKTERGDSYEPSDEDLPEGLFDA